MTNAQEWLDKYYPKEKRNEIKGIHLNEPGLEGELDLRDFETLLEIYISHHVNESKIVIQKNPKYSEYIKTIKLVGAQNWLDYNYPQNGACRREVNDEEIRKGIDDEFNRGKTRSEITTLRISSQKLEGKLDLSGFVNLKELFCEGNFLTNLTLPPNSANLRFLELNNNNFSFQDLSFLSKAINSESIQLGNLDPKRIIQDIYNRFYGSLDCLSEMKKLIRLRIDNTDLNEINIDKLSNSLKWISYSTDYRPKCKLTEITSQLDILTWKDLHSDFNIKERKDWERLGFTKEQVEEWIQVGVKPEDYDFVSWLINYKKITPWIVENNLKNLKVEHKNFLIAEQSKDKINEFIQQHQSGLTQIPYEQLFNIEPLAQGGFGQVFRAEWNQKNVVLKSLNNSQNMNIEFLAEIARHNLFESEKIVKCHGISQEPETKNYVMVMELVKGGNLREYLQKNANKLDFKKKLIQLHSIADGLKEIHKKGLIHKDFHPGNILSSGKEVYFTDLVCLITDLGLCRPANEINKEKVYGVLPYVAPEVLKEKPYTQTSDIYSFGIVAYELFANSYPYPKMDDLELSLKVCQGLRPNIDELKIPQLLKDLIKNCWDANPEQRLTAEKLKESISDWKNEIYDEKDTEFKQQYQKIEKEYNDFSKATPYKMHSLAVKCSKMINIEQNSKKLGTSQAELIKTDNLMYFNTAEIDRVNWEELEEKTISREELQPKLQTHQEQSPK